LPAHACTLLAAKQSTFESTFVTAVREAYLSTIRKTITATLERPYRTALLAAILQRGHCIQVEAVLAAV
jgi:hypothetical protein